MRRIVQKATIVTVIYATAYGIDIAILGPCDLVNHSFALCGAHLRPHTRTGAEVFTEGSCQRAVTEYIGIRGKQGAAPLMQKAIRYIVLR